LSDFVQKFKSITTARYRQGVAENRWTSVGERLWQRGFFDRVIRNRKELNQIRSYISSNPLRWGEGDLLRR
jgi:REP element-mobilizing transposase RayT